MFTIYNSIDNARFADMVRVLESEQERQNYLPDAPVTKGHTPILGKIADTVAGLRSRMTLSVKPFAKSL